MCPVSQEFITQALKNTNYLVSCMHFHHGINCNTKMVTQLVSSSKSLFKMYLIVHLVPFLLFKRKKVKENPKKEFANLLKAFVKSILFAGGYSALTRRGVCFYTTLYNSQGVSCLFAAIISSFTLLFEPVSRQSQISLFCLNKTLETVYQMGLRRGYSVRIPRGEALLTGAALAIICYHYVNNKQSIRENYLKMLDKVLLDC